MLRPYLYFLSLSLGLCAYSQSPIHESLDTLNVGSIAYIQPQDLKTLDGIVVLDTREKAEFEVSHLKNAIWAGYSDFELKRIKSLLPKKTSTIVVYCSIGARSEDIGEKLEQAGYKNIKNLFGGIFLWKNLGYPVFDGEERETKKVHAFSKEWGALLTNRNKVYTTKNDTLEYKKN
ncbi:MAG: rhodanese-like domain-containing protein [Bacteroidota bacterium]